MKNLIKGLGLALALFASSAAQAIPTLFFDGAINFDSRTGLLSVTSVLTGTEDIMPAPNLVGSSLVFATLLTSVDSTSPLFTVGNFGTSAGTDLTVMDGDSNTLLLGDFSSLQMKGGNGYSSGLVTGTLNSTGGDLQSAFGIGNLIALQFNLTTTFSSNMFEDSFFGAIDGRIEGQQVQVPEPAMPALLALGLLVIGFVNRGGIVNRFNA